jgi:hypothetical protein
MFAEEYVDASVSFSDVFIWPVQITIQISFLTRLYHDKIGFRQCRKQGEFV